MSQTTAPASPAPSTPGLPTLEDFRQCGWKSVAAGKANSSELFRAFTTAAGSATACGHDAHAKALTVLADISGMMLAPKNTQAPFKALFNFGDRRSALPDDFTPDLVEILARFAGELDHLFLRARLYDVAWVLRRPRDPKLAHAAIDAYSKFQISKDTWHANETGKALERAFCLAGMLKAKDRIDALEKSAQAAFDKASVPDGLLAIWIARLLAEHRLARSEAGRIAARLDSLAQEFAAVGNDHHAMEYSDAAVGWYRQAGNNPQSAAMLRRVADFLEKQATTTPSSGTAQSGLAAHHFLEQAIHVLRKIPKVERAALKVDERLAALQQKLGQAGKVAIEQMAQIRSPGTDISGEVQRAELAVSGKATLDSLLALARIAPFVNAKKQRESAKEVMQTSVFRALIGSAHMAADGRVVAKKAPVNFDDPKSQEAALWVETVQHYALEMSLDAQARIWPALRAVANEHHLTEADLVELAKASPIVPPGRERLVGKALFEGFDFDFASAIHLLVPQLEHLVRFHLKAAGAKTTTLNTDGIETENGLSALIDLHEAAKVFGENLTFGIKAIFCDPAGPNLRNETAHGLLPDGSFDSAVSLYAWWWFFKLVFQSWWNANRPSTSGPGGETAPTQ